MRPTSPPGSPAISHCDPACWRCGWPIVAGLDERRAPQRLSPGAAALYRMQRRYPFAGVGLRRRNRVAPGFGAHRHGQPFGNRRNLRSRFHSRVQRTHRPPNWRWPSSRVLPKRMQVSVPILAGHCEVAQRIGERIGLSDRMRENLGQLYERWDGQGLPRGLEGRCRQTGGPAGDVGPGRGRAGRGPRARDHGRDDREARAAAPIEPELADLLLAACRGPAPGIGWRGRPRDHPGTGAVAPCGAR